MMVQREREKSEIISRELKDKLETIFEEERRKIKKVKGLGDSLWRFEHEGLENQITSTRLEFNRYRTRTDRRSRELLGKV